MPTGLGDEQLWISATNDNTGTTTALNDLGAASISQYLGAGVTVAADTDEGGTYALSFDGSSTRSWQYSPLLQSNGGYFGWSAWFKVDTIGSIMSIVGGNASSQRKGGELGVDSSGALFLTLNKGTSGVPNVSVTSPTSLNTGQWYHAAASGDGTTARLYLDGVEVASGLFTGFLSPWDRFMRLGSAGSGAADGGYGTDILFFDGLIDDTRFYDRTLTQTDITHLSSSRGVIGPSYSGLGDEQLWLSPTNNNSGTSTAFQDQSVNSNDGTAIGAIVVADTSKGGTYAFEFDGLNDAVSTPYADTATTSTGVFSMACWVKYDSVANTSALMSGNLQTNKVGLSLLFDVFDATRGHGGLLNPKVSSQYSGRIYAGDRDTASTGQWYHVAYTGDGTTARLYIDGVEVNSDAQTLTTTDNWSNFLQLGRYFTSTATAGGHLDGRMDDARVFNRTLTQAEITHLASERGVEGPPPVGLGTEELWVSPTLREDDVSDITGNGNTALIVGTVPVVEDTTGYESFQTDNTTPSTDYVYFSAPTGTTNPTEATIAFWASSSFGSTYDPVGGFCTSGFNDLRFFIARGPFGQARVYRRTTTSGVSVDDFDMPNSNASSNWTDGNMHHWCLVFEGGKNRLYFDGAFLGESATALTGDLHLSGINFSLGSQDGRSTAASAAKYDDIRFYEKALIQAEIGYLAKARGIEEAPVIGIGNEQLWLCPSLNDSADDISGYGNNGTYQGGIGTVADTNLGGTKAYEFNGSTNYIHFYDNGIGGGGGAMDFLVTADWSASFYAKCDNDAGNARDPFFGSRARSGYTGWFASNNDDFGDYTITTNVNNTATYYEWTNDPQLDTDWHHVCFVNNGGTVSLYVDNVLSGTTKSIPDLAEMTSFFIGRAANYFYFDGRMDDIRFYDRAITQEEVAHLSISRGIEGPPPVGLGDEQLWLCPSLNDSADDISGNGNNGTYQGGMATIADTGSGGSYAYEFDGIDDCITTTYGPTSTTSTGVFSMACWVKYDSVAANMSLMAGNVYTDRVGLSMTFDTYSSDRGHAGLLSRKLAGQYSSRIFAGDRDTTLTGQWYHIAYTGDGTTARLYVDGSEVANGLFSGFSALAWSNPLQIGRYIVASSTADGHLNGRLDDIRFFTRTITQSEITHLAEARGIEGPPPVGLGDEKLWLCPSLNDSANDISGNGNNGTLAGGTAVVSDTGSGGTKSFETYTTSTDKVTVPAGVLSDNSDVALSVWIKNKQASASTKIRNIVRTVNDDFKLYAYQTNYIGNAGAVTATDSVGALNTTEYYHYALNYTYATGSIELFRNGVSIGSATGVGAITVSGAMDILQNSFAYADDIRVYDRALTQAEITHLATSRGIEGSPSGPPSSVFHNPFITQAFQNFFLSQQRIR